MYYGMGNRRAARKDWEQALKMDSQRGLSLANLGWLNIDDGLYDEAIHYFTEAIKVEPTVAHFYVNRARAYLESGQPEQALADMQYAKHLVDSGQDTSGRSELSL